MDPQVMNPFSILTFIVAPAILTNASSVMALGTSNRFARAIDRARVLTAEISAKEDKNDGNVEIPLRQLYLTERRARYLVRALTAFYLAVGSFAAASLVSLLGAVFTVAEIHLLRHVSLGLAIAAGFLGISGLVCGSVLLVFETRLTLRILYEHTKQLEERSRELLQKGRR